MWQLNHSNTDYITCTGYSPLTPAGNVRRPSEALPGSGLRLHATIHHQSPLTMCLKKKVMCVTQYGWNTIRVWWKEGHKEKTTAGSDLGCPEQCAVV